MVELREIEERWQREWEEEGIFEARVKEGEKKFFLTVPYPYTSGPLHIGHGRTYTIGDIIARFKRLQGYNVLFPMAFHVTGTPILAIADSIRRGDEKVIRLYKEYVGIYEEDEKKVEEIVNTFTDAKNVAAYFADKISEDFKRMGYSIDWSRRFNTTEPIYNRFVEWQFKKLYDKGAIRKGKYPITYSIEDGCAVGEDDIEEGDVNKVTIVEYTAIKFKFGDAYLVAATLRPETIFGVTNLWVKPEGVYARVRVEGEDWIVSREAAEKLKYQKERVEILEEVRGEDLIGKDAKELVEGREIPVLPARFVDTDVATGVVYSVPAHAPYDYVALEEWKRESGVEIEPIKIIDIEGYDIPAKEICERMGIERQDDERLEEATQVIYKEEFYKGVLNERCKGFAGIRIRDIKDEVKDYLRDAKIADVFYETSRKAVTRGGSKIIAAVLRDQWFIDYTPEWWKSAGHKLVDRMLFYPDKYKEYMHDIVDWLALRPCVRKRGLGTRFPFDKSWVIESLSDSTIYMALYTIIHHLRKLPIEALREEFFDYVFLGIGDAGELASRLNIEEKVLKEIREEFEYWYPNDLRHTAPPHLSNHLAFFLMHHAAIFPEKYWPRAVTLNELMIREGKKISKSRGNVIPLAKVSELYGVDLYRLYCAIDADFSSVVNWREEDIASLRKRFYALIDLLEESVGVEPLKKEEMGRIDRWLLSRFYRRLREAIEQFESFKIREAGINMIFNMMNDIRYYEKRTEGDLGRRRRIVRNIMEDWLKILSPIVPHICEEIWHKLHDSFISLERLPEVKEEFIDEGVEFEEEYLAG
ncbi:MAG: leucine--tRNA ligase, partial [Candidatus Methanospirareceae archaeon]